MRVSQLLLIKLPVYTYSTILDPLSFLHTIYAPIWEDCHRYLFAQRKPNYAIVIRTVYQDTRLPRWAFCYVTYKPLVWSTAGPWISICFTYTPLPNSGKVRGQSTHRCYFTEEMSVLYIALFVQRDLSTITFLLKKSQCYILLYLHKVTETAAPYQFTFFHYLFRTFIYLNYIF